MWPRYMRSIADIRRHCRVVDGQVRIWRRIFAFHMLERITSSLRSWLTILPRHAEIRVMKSSSLHALGVRSIVCAVQDTMLWQRSTRHARSMTEAPRILEDGSVAHRGQTQANCVRTKMSCSCLDSKNFAPTYICIIAQVHNHTVQAFSASDHSKMWSEKQSDDFG